MTVLSKCHLNVDSLDRLSCPMNINNPQFLCTEYTPICDLVNFYPLDVRVNLYSEKLFFPPVKIY